MDARLDVVFFWKQNDTGLYGRRQDMLVQQLARHPQVHRIFHFDAPMDVRQWFRHPGSLGVRHGEAMAVMRQTLRRKLGLADKGKVRFDTFLRLDSRRAGFRTLFRILGTGGSYPDYLERTLRRHGLGERRTVFWVCPTVTDFPAICDRFQPELVVADVIDDQRLWPLTPAERESVDRNYADVLGRADVALANCASVQKGMSRYNGKIHLVPNAADLVRGANRWVKPSELRRLHGPVVGYVGYLDSVRLDVELVAAIAAKRPNWQLVFIGAARQDDPVLALGTLPNVHFLGVRRYPKALRYIRHFDVAMIPHLDNELTRHMNPLKLYVYFSLKVPIVATPIANTDAIGAFVRTGRTADEFVAAIEACLRDDVLRGKEGQMAKLVRENSWEERATRIMALIERALAPPRA